jgi:phosphatidylserine decarboxylase
MRIPVAREGYRYIIPALAVSLAVLYLFPIYSIIPFLVVAYLILFFREPLRKPTSDESTVISPADGRIVGIQEIEENGYLNRRVYMISIFMSIFNVHVNYAPVNGKVDYMYYRKGSFKNALKDAASFINENNTIGIKCRNSTMAVRQIAGMIARRIICSCSVGDEVKAGQKIGIIKFGSRVDIFLPLDSELLVNVSQKVRGGETLLARLK